jgi:hypothetical protein
VAKILGLLYHSLGGAEVAGTVFGVKSIVRWPAILHLLLGINTF